MPKQARPADDTLLEPFVSKLPFTPEADMKTGAALMLEAQRFWAHRMRAYVSYVEKLTQCSAPAQIVDLHMTFWADLQRDYANESAALISAAALNGLPDFAADAAPLPWPRLDKDQGNPASAH